MKTIKYFGVERSVPMWVHWVATDNDNTIYIFENKPKLHNNVAMNDSMWLSQSGNMDYLGDIDLGDVNWVNSLKEFK